MSIRVMEVIRQGEIGGGESHLLDLVKGLKDRKDIIITVVSFSRGAMTDRLEKMNIPVYIIDTQSAFSLSTLKSIKTIIHHEKINIIHAHGSRAACNVAIAARVCNIPLIYTVHGWSFHQNQSRLTYRLRALCEKLICHHSHTVICVSKDNVESGRKTFGLKHAEIIENGIDTGIFCPENTKEIRAELGIGNDDFVVGFIGRMTAQKDPVSFIDSIRIANRQNKNIKGLLVGEGDMDNEIAEYISRNKLEDIVLRSKFRLDIPNVLASIQIYSLCSLWEGLSIGMLEAMAMEKAIVLTPTDGSRTVIDNCNNGFLVPFQSPEKMADTFVMLYNDRKLMETAGKNAGKLVAKRFNSLTVADKVYDIYRKAVGSH